MDDGSSTTTTTMEITSQTIFSRAESSMALVTQHIKTLPIQDIIKILTPVKARLLSEDTILHINTLNFSVDHVVMPLTVKEVLEILGPQWQRWIHNPDATSPPNSHYDLHEHIKVGALDHIDAPPTDFVKEFIEGLTKKQKRSILTLIRDGLLTDESFLNVSTYTGPDRVQVSMKKVVDIISMREQNNLIAHNKKNIFLRLALMQHYSSACFEKMQKTDLNVSQLRNGRQKMSIWYTIAFALMTIGTLLSHVWSNATNYELMQSQLSVTIGILVIASIAIASLVYFVMYMVAFLFCCEHSLSKTGLKPFISEKQNTVIKHFNTIHQYEYRIIATKTLQFILLWYTMLLAVYAHENELNIYPALTCVLTNGFGLLLFARISHFFHACRSEGKILYAQ